MTEPDDNTPTITWYEALGGEVALRRLVDRFYALMDELPEAYTVRRIHPEHLQGAADSLFEFLSGWLGGPPLYSHRHGHPRLRMRHHPYAIGVVERDEWMLCMQQALDEEVAEAGLRQALATAFGRMADHLVNTSAPARGAGPA